MDYRRVPYISLNERRQLIVSHFRKAWLIVTFGLILFVVGVFVLFNNEVITEPEYSFEPNKIDGFDSNVVFYSVKRHVKLFHWTKHFRMCEQ